MGNMPVTPITKISPKDCDTNGRRTATQMGGALKVFPFLRAQGHREHGNTNWRRIGTRKWDWSGLCPFPLRKSTGRGQTGEGGER